jgi:hypothetical protein
MAKLFTVNGQKFDRAGAINRVANNNVRLNEAAKGQIDPYLNRPYAPEKIGQMQSENSKLLQKLGPKAKEKVQVLTTQFQEKNERQRQLNIMNQERMKAKFNSDARGVDPETTKTQSISSDDQPRDELGRWT